MAPTHPPAPAPQLLEPQFFGKITSWFLNSLTQDLVLRLGIHRKLKKHHGSVNCVSFNANGDILISGSNDMKIILWDWETGLVKLAFNSSHEHNVLQAQFVPYSDDRKIVTSDADGEVRLVLLQDGGQCITSLLGKHYGAANKIAIRPDSPHIFYSCGEDGLVHYFDLRTRSAMRLFICEAFQDKSYYMPKLNLYAIAINPTNPNLFAIAGSDEYARIYDIRKRTWGGKVSSTPVDCFGAWHLIGENEGEICGLAFSDLSELLVSYFDEHIYLFSKGHGLGSDPVSPSYFTQALSMHMDDMDYMNKKSTDSPNKNLNFKPGPEVYKGHHNSCGAIRGVSFFGPHCKYVVSGSECGRIFIWRKKGGELLRRIEGGKHAAKYIDPHPWTTTLASSGIDHDIKIWVPNATEPAGPINMTELMVRDGDNVVLTNDSSNFSGSDNYVFDDDNNDTDVDITRENNDDADDGIYAAMEDSDFDTNDEDEDNNDDGSDSDGDLDNDDMLPDSHDAKL